MECRVLIVDDDEALQYTFREVFSAQGYTVETTGDPYEALRIVPIFVPHIVVLDYSMPKMSGLELLGKLREKYHDIIYMMITAYGSEDLAVKAMKAGAYDYFKKPFDNDEIVLILDKARERLHLLEKSTSLQKKLVEKVDIVGESSRMKEILAVVDQVAATDVTVLIQGESGTGKELIANAVHARSRRASGPFVKLNCAALPETLIESELFGYEQGAFTGATQRKKGRFELADGGTIFLDEIGDMTPSTQTKVLRVLQEREFERLGGGKVINVDVRVIAATHQRLDVKIREGSFREDLYYRLNVLNIKLPALRERLDDLKILATHFLGHYAEQFGKPRAALPDALLERMKQYHWPGNIRELENGIARAVVLDNLDLVIPQAATAGSPPPAVPPSATVSRGAAPSLAAAGAELFNQPLPVDFLELPYKEAKHRLLDAFEKQYFDRMLVRAGGNTTKAARMAGMHRKNFWQKLKHAGPEPEGPDGGDPEEGP
ncbi:MAG: sigma-54-dependent Fis family transcriptional regulator [Candidatus Wallbacteria bacterium]|nr:sigma-54-dependent Fis family transcriptional regulator [Candidatus Wallbacteria bacterium]